MSTIALLLALSATVGPQADACDQSAVSRAQAIHALLTSEAQKMRLWRAGWTAGFGGVAAIQVGLAGMSDRPEQTSYYIGTGLALLGAGAKIVLTESVTAPEGPAPNDLEACARLPELERALTNFARVQRTGRAWYQHLLVAAANLARFVIYGLIEKDWARAALETLPGLAVGEAAIWTQPTGAMGFVRKRPRTERIAVMPSGVLWAF